MQLMAYAIFASVLLIAPATGILPPVNRNAAALRETIFGVAMPPPTIPVYEGGRYRPIFARQLAKWYTAWAVALILALPFALAMAATSFSLAPPLLRRLRGFGGKPAGVSVSFPISVTPQRCSLRSAWA